jgi:hypothetical protein
MTAFSVIPSDGDEPIKVDREHPYREAEATRLHRFDHVMIDLIDTINIGKANTDGAGTGPRGPDAAGLEQHRNQLLRGWKGR